MLFLPEIHILKKIKDRVMTQHHWTQLRAKTTYT
jgi:hypothetical protein